MPPVAAEARASRRRVVQTQANVMELQLPSIRRRQCAAMRLSAPAWGLLAAAWLAAGSGAAAPPDAPPVIVRLRAEAEPTGATIRLGDVADVSAGTRGLEQRLREVDLVNVEDPAGVERLGKRFIDLRLQLAGFSAGEYELVGPPEVLLKAPAPPLLTSVPRPTDAALEEIARSVLSRLLNVQESELRVALSAPVMDALIGSSPPADDLRIDLVPRGQPGLGQQVALVRLFSQERLLASRTAQFDVAQRIPVLVTTATLPRGEVLTADMVREERRFLSQPTDSLLPEHVVGQRLAVTLPAGEVVQSRHLTRNQLATDPPVIQPRDAVRVTARKSGLLVVLRNAEALQAGRPGQLIRVRNPETNQVVIGRVIAAGEVEVSFE